MSRLVPSAYLKRAPRVQPPLGHVLGVLIKRLTPTRPRCDLGVVLRESC
jgi:hypothetical protein